MSHFFVCCSATCSQKWLRDIGVALSEGTDFGSAEDPSFIRFGLLSQIPRLGKARTHLLSRSLKMNPMQARGKRRLRFGELVPAAKQQALEKRPEKGCALSHLAFSCLVAISISPTKVKLLAGDLRAAQSSVIGLVLLHSHT